MIALAKGDEATKRADRQIAPAEDGLARADQERGTPSLRATRSNPESDERGLDCFVARAPRNDGL
jgi:hypothetical protein